MRRHVYFSEYRPHDYRTPRSMREAYQCDVPLYVPEEPSTGWHGWLLWLVAIGLLVWYVYGWL